MPGKARISARDMEAIFPFALEGRLQCMLGLSLSFSICRGKDSCSTYLPCGNREPGAGGALQSLRGACSHQKLLWLPFCVFLIFSFLHPKLLCFIECGCRGLSPGSCNWWGSWGLSGPRAQVPVLDVSQSWGSGELSREGEGGKGVEGGQTGATGGFPLGLEPSSPDRHTTRYPFPTDLSPVAYPAGLS